MCFCYITEVGLEPRSLSSVAVTQVMCWSRTCPDISELVDASPVGVQHYFPLTVHSAVLGQGHPYPFLQRAEGPTGPSLWRRGRDVSLSLSAVDLQSQCALGHAHQLMHTNTITLLISCVQREKESEVRHKKVESRGQGNSWYRGANQSGPPADTVPSWDQAQLPDALTKHIVLWKWAMSKVLKHLSMRQQPTFAALMMFALRIVVGKVEFTVLN